MDSSIPSPGCNEIAVGPWTSIAVARLEVIELFRTHERFQHSMTNTLIGLIDMTVADDEKEWLPSSLGYLLRRRKRMEIGRLLHSDPSTSISTRTN
jgi:hypothetical protein